MIKKVTQIMHEGEADDAVVLSWFDMQKPHLSTVSDKGVEFILKVSASHLHANDLLVCEDGYRICVHKGMDEVIQMTFDDAISFATIAYEIGNRHQPICIMPLTIMVLNDAALHPLMESVKEKQGIHVQLIHDFFQPSGKAHHAH